MFVRGVLLVAATQLSVFFYNLFSLCARHPSQNPEGGEGLCVARIVLCYFMLDDLNCYIYRCTYYLNDIYVSWFIVVKKIKKLLMKKKHNW